MLDMKNLPAPKYWQKARLKWLLEYEPLQTREKHQKDPQGLHQELIAKAQQAVKRRRVLKSRDLADDQISEIVLNLVRKFGLISEIKTA